MCPFSPLVHGLPRKMHPPPPPPHPTTPHTHVRLQAACPAPPTRVLPPPLHPSGQVEASFSQPNAGMCCSMLSWARSVTAGSSGRDLLELYCGNGNFTVALAPNFRKVGGCSFRWTGYSVYGGGGERGGPAGNGNLLSRLRPIPKRWVAFLLGREGWGGALRCQAVRLA